MQRTEPEVDHTTAFLAPMFAALVRPLIHLGLKRAQRATASWQLMAADYLLAATVVASLGAFVIAQALVGGILAPLLAIK
jgi:hypothetical protein